jgi:hypothetical protein
MPRLEIPLLSKKVWATGEVLIRAEIELLIRDGGGVLRPETFRVDSGTEMTSMAAARARVLNLPMPQHHVVLEINGFKHEVRAGLIRAQVAGIDGAELVFPCYFLGSPNSALGPSPLPIFARNLLGLTGVVDKLRIHFDGTPSPSARHGYLVVEKN